MSAASPHRPHIVVVNRWRERYADYARYVDHTTHAVTYVTTEVGTASVPSTAAEIVTIEATDDLDAVRAAIRDLAGRHGRPAHIVALKEDDLLVGAQLRVEWDCPGPRPADLRPFRDKHTMTQTITKAGLPVPPSALIEHPRQVEEFAAVHGWPVVVKPLLGSSSAGVIRLDGPRDLTAPAFDEPLLAQAFNPHPIHHVDGVFTGTELSVVRSSHYLNTCMGFREGTVLGSVEDSDQKLSAIIAEASRQVMRALTDRPTVFHLELFVDQSSSTCTFLEVGARTGGAEIPFIWRELHGYDLMENGFRIQLGLPPHEPPAHQREEYGGWLLVPAPAQRPCRITEVTSMTGRHNGPYREEILPIGEVLPQADSYYEHVGGRFRFRGQSSAEVEMAIRATAADFRVAARPLQHAELPGS
ncbi:acetyl-CoA carboxylase biotin carboxylase subunit family protein [Streptomyces sp. NPDC005244]|uniref:ATP-grasp domain-containing protein n=1 Tax=Streptomyces sp. NPDC005244 TaxID=3364708 RepID=UPI0036C4F2EE